MKMLSTSRVSLLGAMLACVGISDAIRETLSVTEAGIDFTVVAFDDGRVRPLRIRFTKDDTISSFTFNRDDEVAIIRIGGERYRVSRNNRWSGCGEVQVESSCLVSSRAKCVLIHESLREVTLRVRVRSSHYPCRFCVEIRNTRGVCC